MAKKQTNKALFKKIKSSSRVTSIGYNPVLSQLTVGFTGNYYYDYTTKDVNLKSVYDEIVKMEKANTANPDKHLSIGKYFNEVIIKAGITGKSHQANEDPATKKV